MINLKTLNSKPKGLNGLGAPIISLFIENLLSAEGRVTSEALINFASLKFTVIVAVNSVFGSKLRWAMILVVLPPNFLMYRANNRCVAFEPSKQ